MERMATFADAVNESLATALELDSKVICYGLGVPDPKGVFGTTTGLQERFGKERVFDMPTAENGMTGVAIGAAIAGLRPIVTHQRLDFFLLAMDQLVNNAAKWHYMFGGTSSVPITIRLILGRGWGQGPTHCQSLQSWFAHVPGLKVVMPATPADAKGLLLSGIFDPNPVVYLEHRWLHNQKGYVPAGDYRVPLGEAAVLRSGNDLTIVAMSYMTVEALRAADYLSERGVSVEVIDLRSIRPIDWDTLSDSVCRTGRLLCLDTSWPSCSVSSEIVATLSMKCWDALKGAPRRIALPDVPSPTSFGLTRNYYPDSFSIVSEVADMLALDIDVEAMRHDVEDPHDVPGKWFRGPF
tara:strand:+ start:1124 stop:2182 length:1059 start_codon:yes stop_codon:yes gene_type:complete